MEMISAEEVFASVAERAGLERDEIDPALFRTLRGSLRRRVREGYQFAKWPELTLIEKRYFRPIAQAGEAVMAGTERFVVSTRDYYQALKDTTTFPVDAAGETTAAWTLAMPVVAAADLWDAAVTYAVGGRVTGASDDLIYQLHTSGPAGTPTSDAGFWGVVNEFDRFVAYEAVGETKIGTVFGVTRNNPRATAAVCPVRFSKSADGVQVLVTAGTLPFVWVEFRRRPPGPTGEVWDGSAAVPDDQIYFDGDFYVCLEATALNESPAVSPGKWEKLELPLFLERWLVQSIYADYLETEGQKEKSMSELAAARSALEEEAFVLGAQEGQTDAVEVLVR